MNKIKASVYFQRPIENPVEHLQWSFSAETVNGKKPLTIYASIGTSFLFGWVLNTPLISITTKKTHSPSNIYTTVLAYLAPSVKRQVKMII